MSKWQTYEVRVGIYEGVEKSWCGTTWYYVKARTEDEATRKALKEADAQYQLEGSTWKAEVLDMKVVAE